MFVLIVTNGFPTKDCRHGIFALDQARALKNAGHKVAVIALDLRSIRRKRGYGFNRFRIEGIDLYLASIPLGRVPARLSESVSRAACRSVYKRVVADQGRPDVIHAHFYDMGIAAGAISRDNDIPLVITEHFSGLNKESVPENLRDAAVRSYANADGLIAVSCGLADNLKKNTGFDFRVVSNVVDTDVFTEVCRRETTGDGRPISLISVGNMVPIKGFDGLLRAFRKALDMSGREMKLTLVGDGTERRSLEQQARDLGIEGSVTFTGQLDRREIAGLFAESDVFVLLSNSETFGVAYIEAMASGLPVIATRCGGPEEFVNETNGLMVPVGDDDAYAKAIIDMSIHAGDYDKEKIREEVLDRFSPEKIADRLTLIYEELLSKHGA